MAVSCENKVFQNILSTCENKITAGITQKIYLINLDDIESVTYDSSDYMKVTGITLKSGKTAYTAEGLKQNFSASFERVIDADTGLDTYTDTINLNAFEFDSEAARNLAEMGNFAAVVVRNGKKLDNGSVLIFGLGAGLWCSTDTWSAWENGGSRQLTFSSQEGAGEEVAYYAYCVQAGETPADSYNATIAQLDAMLS